MTKILFFMDTLSAGGAEKVLRTLVNNMDQAKFDITVQTLEAADPAGLLAPGIRYKAINRSRSALGRKLCSYWLRLCAELKWMYPLYIRDDYDVEVAYLECGPTKILAGSTNKKARKIAWVHCDLARKEGMAEQAEKLKGYYQKYDQVVCVSENVRDSFRRMFGDISESVVLHNVNDESEILEKAEAFDVPRKSGAELVAVGRLAEQKGFDRLLEACAMLKKDGMDFHLHILGEGPERSSLEAQIAREGLEAHVELMGQQSNPYPYIKGADVVVCSSRYEGLSTAVTEALILGKAVVTTPCTGMRELLGDSEYGLITADSTEGIYEGLKTMLDDPELRIQYAGASAIRSQAFSKEKVLGETQAFFLELTNERGLG